MFSLQCFMNESPSHDGNSAIRSASGSHHCSKKTGTSPLAKLTKDGHQGWHMGSFFIDDPAGQANAF